MIIVQTLIIIDKFNDDTADGNENNQDDDPGNKNEHNILTPSCFLYTRSHTITLSRRRRKRGIRWMRKCMKRSRRIVR